MRCLPIFVCEQFEHMIFLFICKVFLRILSNFLADRAVRKKATPSGKDRRVQVAIWFSREVFLQRRLPEAMQVAVGVGRDDLRTAEREYGFGFAANGQALALSAVVRLQIDPSDVVLLEHRVVNAANVNGTLVAFHLDDGNVLFMARVNAAGDQLGHMLAAAGHRGSGRVNHANEVAADFAAEETGFTCHDEVPP